MLHLMFRSVFDDFLVFLKKIKISKKILLFIKIMIMKNSGTPMDNREQALSGANIHIG